jgi:hypothetical protein
MPMIRSLRELGQLEERLRHRVERVGDGMMMRRRVLDQLRRDALHDVEVVAHQVVAAHVRPRGLPDVITTMSEPAAAPSRCRR